MSKIISHVQLTKSLGLTECKDGWWLYDKTRGMNLSMRAKTSQDAFVECISYYQHKLKEKERLYSELYKKVESFVSQFCEEEWCEEE